MLGLNADEIHLSGDLSVFKYLFERSVLKLGINCMNSIMRGLSHWWLKPIPCWEVLKNVCSGDCVVAILREEIFEVKMGIENHTNHLYCVIYGALPPETRRR